MHIANITSTSPDDLLEPIDLGQTPADVIVLSFSDSDLAALSRAWSKDQDDLPDMRLAALRHLRHPMSVDLWIDAVARHARVIVVRLLGGYDWWSYGCDQLAQLALRENIALAFLPGEDCLYDERLTKLSTIDEDELTQLLGFFRQGGAANMSALLAHLARLKGDDLPAAACVSVPRMGFYRTGDGIVSLDHLLAQSLEKTNRVGILFYRSILLADDISPIDELCAALQKRGVCAVPIFVPTLKDEEVVAFVVEAAKRAKLKVLVTTTAFAADVGQKEPSVFDQIGIPVFQAILATTRHEAWLENDNGLGISDLAMNVVLPELDGRLLAGALSFKSFAGEGEGEQANHGPLQFAALQNRADASRVGMIAARIKAMITLQETKAFDRRIIIMLPDYPGADGRMGYAVGLDVPQSVRLLLKDLQEAGYDLGERLPQSERALLAALKTPSEFMPAYQWKQVFERFSSEVQTSVIKAWGKVPHEDFAFRAASFGKITIALAPDRGLEGKRRADYHDPALPPSHALLAFGHWIREMKRCQALVHCGAHGTFEWLPGKNVALSQNCFPELVLGALPVIYPFIVSNPGEAAQAKRRIAALTIGHMPPPMIGAGLTDEQIELEHLVDEFVQADGLDNRRRKRLQTLILDKAQSTGIAQVAGVAGNDDEGDALKQIDAWLCDLKDFVLKDGQHVFGRVEPDCSDELRKASAKLEKQNLLKALEGRFVAAGPSGSPLRGRLDVYPTGRNLYTIDPRTMPTPVAHEMGKMAADEVLRYYVQEHGDWPRALVMDLWGSASLRTGGEEIAQGLALMGARPKWDFETGRVISIEILPAGLVGHPRVDVTWRISGLFRDMFPQIIALMSAAVEAIAALDENPDDNPLAAAAKESGLAPLRIFGSAPGSFGSGIEPLLESGTWQSRDELGDRYLQATSHAFAGPKGAPIAVPGVFSKRVEQADLLVHGGDDPGRDMLEGAADVAFVGGFSAALKLLGGTADIVALDTTDPQQPRARSLVQALGRIVHGRVLNPRYIEGQMRHGPRGASDFAETVDRLVGFCETSDAVSHELMERVHETYVSDPKMRAFLLRENPAAARVIGERLSSARNRGVWHARRNHIDQELSQLIEQAKTAEELS